MERSEPEGKWGRARHGFIGSRERGREECRGPRLWHLCVPDQPALDPRFRWEQFRIPFT